MNLLPYRSWVEISRTQIAANFRAVRDAAGPTVELMPVVKADAYRHGALAISRTLEDEGARWLAVSNTDEGIALRESGVRARILVMADFLPWTREALLAHDLTPVVFSLRDLEELNALAEQHGRRYRYHLKIDSGMGRLGVRESLNEVGNAISAAKAVKLEGLMTHFASAANYVPQQPGDAATQTDQQVAYFDAMLTGLAEKGIEPELVHLFSSIPVAYGRKHRWRGLVRPGHAIYGYVSPARGHAPKLVLDVAPALSWRATILSVKDIPAGALVGYGGMFRAPKQMRIGVLAAGYADGIPHRLSNRGQVIAAGKLAAVLGAVSMDVTTVDLSDAPQLGVGEAVTLLGTEGNVTIDAQQMAKAAGTISYNVLTGIHARVKRVYV